MFDWRERLASLGFQQHTSGLQNRLLFDRAVGPREVSVILIGRELDDRTAIQLAISMPDPYSTEKEAPVILSGYLDRTHGVLTEVLAPGSWWAPVHEESAWQALRVHGLPWLERFSRPTDLVRFYESGLDVGVPTTAPAPEAQAWIGRLTRFLAPGRAEPPVRRPPIYHRWLSLIYEEAGNRDQACRHARAYRDHLGDRPIGEEPARTLRQLEALGC